MKNWVREQVQEQQIGTAYLESSNDVHLSIINMPLPALKAEKSYLDPQHWMQPDRNAKPSWAVTSDIRKPALLSANAIGQSWIAKKKCPENLLCNFQALSNEKVSYSTVTDTIDIVFPSRIFSIRWFNGTMILASTTKNRCGNGQRNQKYDFNLPENLEA